MLQFTDDTMFFLCRYEDVASRVHCYLMIFSMISVLSINLYTSFVLGTSTNSDFVVEVANELHCRLRIFSMIYHGLPIGGRVVDCSSWEHMVELFKFRLAQCKSKHLSLGERLTFIKSVLKYIHIYALSVHILPADV